MNKITIPIILTATVIIAGFFAISPVEQAITVHSSNLIESSASPFVTVSTTITNTFAVADQQFHWVILESTQPYTILDIELQGTLDAGMGDFLDRVRINTVASFNGEYATSVAGINQALNLDSFEILLCQNCARTFLDGDDRFDTFTYSFTEGEINQNNPDPPTAFSFGPNTKIFLQTEQRENDNDPGDITTVVTFYLSGPSAADVTLTVFEDQNDES